MDHEELQFLNTKEWRENRYFDTVDRKLKIKNNAPEWLKEQSRNYLEEVNHSDRHPRDILIIDKDAENYGKPVPQDLSDEIERLAKMSEPPSKRTDDA